MTREIGDDSSPIVSELVREDASFADLVEGFVNSMADRLVLLEDALVAGDFESLRMRAHQLKGSGGGYGFPMLTDHAGTLEQAAGDRLFDDCRKALDALNRISSRIVVRDDSSATHG